MHVPRRWQDGNNDVLRAAAAAHPTVEFVDWDALVDANPGVLGPDGVHPGVAGRTLLANAVADAARSALTQPRRDHRSRCTPRVGHLPTASAAHHRRSLDVQPRLRTGGACG